jgi:hypothetical protein
LCLSCNPFSGRLVRPGSGFGPLAPRPGPSLSAGCWSPARAPASRSAGSPGLVAAVRPGAAASAAAGFSGLSAAPGSVSGFAVSGSRVRACRPSRYPQPGGLPPPPNPPAGKKARPERRGCTTSVLLSHSTSQPSRDREPGRKEEGARPRYYSATRLVSHHATENPAGKKRVHDLGTTQPLTPRRARHGLLGRATVSRAHGHAAQRAARSAGSAGPLRGGSPALPASGRLRCSPLRLRPPVRFARPYLGRPGSHVPAIRCTLRRSLSARATVSRPRRHQRARQAR